MLPAASSTGHPTAAAGADDAECTRRRFRATDVSLGTHAWVSLGACGVSGELRSLAASESASSGLPT